MTVKTMARLHEGEARMKCIKSFNLTPFELTRSMYTYSFEELNAIQTC